MSKPYRVVRLMKNRLYPTYQLHAFMANDKTAPLDGLRLAALTAMQWLKARLGDDAPAEWDALPAPEDYLTATDSDLPSLYVNQGHVVNIVSLPDRGMWTLQITEPDLGSDPGNPEQARPAVPGRIIETNIAFQITGKELECGFRIVISDPVGTELEAEVYRPAIVRQLMREPAFGLKQVTRIPMQAGRLTNGAQVKTMLYVTQHADNELPAVVFTQTLEERKAAPSSLPGRPGMKSGFAPPLQLDLAGLGLPAAVPAGGAGQTAVEPPFDLDRFCYYTFSHCRTYVLEQAAFKAFTAQSGIRFRPGEIVLIFPNASGGGERVISCGPSEKARADTLAGLEYDVKAYMKARPVSFGRIVFLSGAREHMLRLSDKLAEDAEAADARFRQELEQLRTESKNALAQKDRELEELSAQLRRQKEYTARVQAEKTELREAFSAERELFADKLASREEMIRFLRRRNDQPRGYDGIAAWAEKHFGDRLLLHPKAVARMMTRSCQCAEVELICDALDYLATDYWEQRYAQLPKEAALTRCSEKYGRPFEIKPTGRITIDYAPAEYYIKYFRDPQGRARDSALDWHLRVGNDPENLLRIYFLHDDGEKRIVVGSLPDHLSTVTIR